MILTINYYKDVKRKGRAAPAVDENQPSSSRLVDPDTASETDDLFSNFGGSDDEEDALSEYSGPEEDSSVSIDNTSSVKRKGKQASSSASASKKR